MVVVYKSNSLWVHAVTESGYPDCDALMLIKEHIEAIHAVFPLLPTLLYGFLNSLSCLSSKPLGQTFKYILLSLKIPQTLEH